MERRGPFEGDSETGEDRLLTVSSDRNGYVWTRQGDQSWKPSLVLLRLKRGASCTRWSQDGKKLAVGSAEGIVSVAHYEAENDWWVCKHIRGSLDGSAILSLAWHPEGRFLAVSTLEGNVSVIAVPLKQIDGDSEGFDSSQATIKVGHWVHSLSWSPSGSLLAMAGHNGAVHLFSSDTGDLLSLPSPSDLPVKRILFLSEQIIIGCGYISSSPFLLFNNGSKWTLEGEILGTPSTSASTSASASAFTSTTSRSSSTDDTKKTFGGALAKFKALDSQGVAIKKEQENSSVKNNPIGVGSRTSCTPHSSSISEIRSVSKTNFSSSSFDGRVALWDLSATMAQLGLKNL